MPLVCSSTPRVSGKWNSNWITEIEGVHRIELEGTFTGAGQRPPARQEGQIQINGGDLNEK